MSDELEQLLQSSLRRVDAPSGFSGRVMGQLPQKRSPVVRWRLVAALAATLLVMTSSVITYEQRQSALRQEQQRAGQELIFALQLTSEKIAAVDQRLKKSSAQLLIPDKSDLVRKEQ